MTQTSTPKSLEEVAIKVMKANKATELFQTMAIMSLNMGNLTTQEEEVQIEESQDFINGTTQEEEVQPKMSQDLRGGGQDEKNLEGI